MILLNRPSLGNVTLDLKFFKLSLKLLTGRWAGKLFHHTNTGGFLLLPLESSRLPILSMASPIFFENQEEQHIQPTGNKKYQ
jgi:hypothetical protein